MNSSFSIDCDTKMAVSLSPNYYYIDMVVVYYCHYKQAKLVLHIIKFAGRHDRHAVLYLTFYVYQLIRICNRMDGCGIRD